MVYMMNEAMKKMIVENFELKETFADKNETSYDVYENGVYVAYIVENREHNFFDIYIYDAEEDDHPMSFLCDSIEDCLEYI